MIQLIRMKKHVRTKGEESGTETERERGRERRSKDSGSSLQISKCTHR